MIVQPAVCDQVQHFQVTGIQILIFVDNEHVVFDSIQLGMVVKCLSQREWQLSQQCVTIYATMLMPSREKSRALLRINLRQLEGLQIFPIRRHLTDEIVQLGNSHIDPLG
jgi:hypothetical protein